MSLLDGTPEVGLIGSDGQELTAPGYARVVGEVRSENDSRWIEARWREDAVGPHWGVVTGILVDGQPYAFRQPVFVAENTELCISVPFVI